MTAEEKLNTPLKYHDRGNDFDRRFMLLVTKGGLNYQTYRNHRHYYCLGYYS